MLCWQEYGSPSTIDSRFLVDRETRVWRKENQLIHAEFSLVILHSTARPGSYREVNPSLRHDT